MSYWNTLRSLPLVIESLSWDSKLLHTNTDFDRITTIVTLHGAGQVGLGEELAYNTSEQELFQRHVDSLDLTGSWTIESFSEHLTTLDLFGGPEPGEGIYRQPWYRTWTFESAALDLALRQAGTNLADLLGLSYEPVRFCASTGLGSPPSTEPIQRMQRSGASTEFKLDVTREWTPQLVDEIAAFGGLAVVDIKAHYGLGDMDERVAPPELLRSLVEALPDTVLLEDAPLTPEAREALGSEGLARLAWDAPIHSWDDVDSLADRPAAVNIKPSRFGSIKEVLRAIEQGQERGIPLYSGGQFELGIGRAQIQELASLFYPTTANDCAPVAYHTATADSDLPTSPLAPSPAPGFGPTFEHYLA